MTGHEGSKKGFKEKWVHISQREQKFFAEGAPKSQNEWIFRERYRFIERRLRVDQRSLLCLEVGAGRGTTSLYLVKAGHRSILLDSSATALEMSRSNFESEEMPANFVKSFAENMGIRTSSVDVVVTLGLLEHFEDIYSPLVEMARVLKPGGLLFSLNIPTKPFSANLLAWPYNYVLIQARRLIRFRDSFSRWRSGNFNRVYRNSLKPGAYRKAALAAGFREVSCVATNPVPSFQPVPHWVDRQLVRFYDGISLFRKFILMKEEPFVTSFLWGRDHFIIARK